MTRFRPCIDLHQGVVKQIVGGSLRDQGEGPTENFVATKPPGWFAETFRRDQLTGGHIIKLGPGNDEAAREALAAWPGGLQVGGGITPINAAAWLDAGASHVIVTSCLFDASGHFHQATLDQLVREVGADKLVIDLSCRRQRSPGAELSRNPTGQAWVVAMNRWQTLTNLSVSHATLDKLAPYCAEFLIHSADVEGLRAGIDEALVELLGQWGKAPVTYAGGATTMSDLETIEHHSGGRLDVTVGSALDLFGGDTLAYRELVEWNRRSSAV